MLITTCVIAGAALGWQEPGPLDAFRANYAAMRVEMDYEYRKSLVLEPESIDPEVVWSGQPLAFPEDEAERIVGHWACDGRTEYFEAGSPSEQIELGADEPRELGQVMPYMPRIEALWDPEGPTLASHTIEGLAALTQKLMVQVWEPAEPGSLRKARSPFLWWLNYPFPLLAEKHFEGIRPQRVPAIVGGHPVEFEIYSRDEEGSQYRFEVAYDPAIGYLPRFARFLFLRGYEAFVDEVYVTRAEPCKAGGFVISEWYEVRSWDPRFSRRYPDYDHTTKVRPAERFTIGHFRAENLRDLEGEVALRKLEDVRHLTANGLVIDLPKGLNSLSMSQIRRRLGDRLTNPPPAPLSMIDREELAEYAGPMPEEKPFWLLIAVGTVVVTTFAVVAIRQGRRAWLGLAIIVPFCLGCQRTIPPEPEVNLTAAFEPARFLCDWEAPLIRTSLLIENEGRNPVRLLNVDGGCSCRKVDLAGFPVVLPAGSSVSLDIDLSNPRTIADKNHPFSVQTDAGTFQLGARLQAIPRHRLHPESINHSALVESQDWTFDLTHRSIFPTNEPASETELTLPAGFEAERIGTTSGKVHDASGYSYQESSYRITLRSTSLGLHREEITLQSPSNQTLARSTIVWRRSPHLSTVPGRAILGPRPVRLFLRCPDETVELTNIHSVPEGIEAVVSSIREVTVWLADDAPSVIDGEIEVGTTAEGKPPLRVPVIRYTTSTVVADSQEKGPVLD
ncbi:hypothetical protein AB1L88_07370 [Tautonia sp. JC769]|uniref:hypothetical protein n=1 Tax=Tautonia sp. JC769 TaxID=3232135 RepID=UPI0034574592